MKKHADSRRARRRPMPMRFAIAAAVLLALGCGPRAHAQDPATQIADSESELAEVRAELKALSAEIEADRGARDSLEREASALERSIGDARAELSRLERRIAQQRVEVDSAERRQQQAQADLARLRRELSAQLRAAYIAGRSPETRLLLAQDDPLRIGRLMVYLDYFGQAQRQRLDRLQETLGELVAIGEQLRVALDELAALEREQRATVARLERDRSQRAEAVAELDAELRAADARRAELQREQEQLNELVNELRRTLASRQLPASVRLEGPFASHKGRLPWPVRGPLLASFGQPKADGRLKWNGLWIGADSGTPVRAVAGGRVAYVGFLQRFGLLIIVEHEGGFFSLYGHNQSVERQVGDTVGGGDVIAIVGDTGGHPRPGLYFELRAGKNPVDPRSWFADR